MHELIITTNEHDQRADRYLHKIFDVPKPIVQKWFRNKKIKRDKVALQASDRIFESDVLMCYVHADFRIKKSPTAIRSGALDILYEDEHILILYKPQGMLSHAAHGAEYGKNLVDRMVAYLIEKGEFVPRANQAFSPAIVNRLDRNTAGLIIGCKTYASLKAMNEAMREGKIRKFYTAVTTGKRPKPGVYESRWTKDEKKLTVKMDEDPEGKETRTDILSVEPIGTYSKVKIELHTGRTHQIRSLLKSIGSPIIGDAKYGDPVVNRKLSAIGLTYQFLICDELRFEIETGPLSHLNGLSVSKTLNEKYQTILEKLDRD